MIKLVIKNIDINKTLTFPSKLILVEEIQGMDGLDSDIISSTGMNMDGSKYICSNVKERNVPIKLGIRTTDKDVIDEIRRMLLSFLKPKDNIRLFYKGKYAYGRVESAPKFSKGGVITHGSLSILCSDPYLYSGEIKQEIALWKKDLHFPISFTGKMPFGHREPTLIVNVKNNGDVPTGMKIIFKAIGTVKNPSLFDVYTRNYIKINIELKDGQQVIVDTTPGNKKIILNDNGIESKIMNHIDYKSKFLQLNVGDNLFRYNADENINNLSVDIYYFERYVGV